MVPKKQKPCPGSKVNSEGEGKGLGRGWRQGTDRQAEAQLDGLAPEKGGM